MNGVKARQLVWSDPEIHALTRRFVPVAEELHRLRKGTDPESLFFQKVFDQKQEHPGHQGVFVCTASGDLLASCVTWEGDTVEATLRRAIEAWERRTDDHSPTEPPAEPLAASPTHPDRIEYAFPDDGLAIRVTGRDLGSASSDQRWNRSFVWFNREELQSMLPPATVGAQRDVPRDLAVRLASLAFLDKGNVDGFTKPFVPADVEEVHVTFETVRTDDDNAYVVIRGQTATRTRDGQPAYGLRARFERVPDARGVNTELLGTATFDRESRRISQLEMVALGERFGGAHVGRPPGDWGPSPIGFSIRLSDGSPAERIAPEFPDRYPWLGTRP